MVSEDAEATSVELAVRFGGPFIIPKSPSSALCSDELVLSSLESFVTTAGLLESSSPLSNGLEGAATTVEGSA